MQLSPQQKRIVESLLAGKKCKEIGPELGLAAPTVRTYLKRIYERQGVEDHVALLLRIMAVAVRTPVQSTSHGQEPRPDDILREG